MNVLLIAPDSKLPNLALMKYATYYRGRAEMVGLNVGEPDLIIGSIVFSKNKHLPRQWKMMYPDAEIIVGGPGYDPKIKLPSEIEQLPPRQDLYQSKYSIGRVTSGCPRRCPFCIVPLLEPDGIRYIQPPREIWKAGTILRLLDDNILAMPEAFYEVIEFCKDCNVKMHFEYLDARLITEDMAKALLTIHHDGQIKFSFDITSQEKGIVRGLKIMIEAGHRPANIQAFVYLQDGSSIPDAMHRWDVIRGLGCEPFLMVNNEHRTARLKKIARRGCRPAIWRNLTTAEVFE